MSRARSSSEQPGVLILGGTANALAIARSLGRRGIEVRCAATLGSPQLDSRYCSQVFCRDPESPVEAFWLETLRTHLDTLRGSVILPCDDEAVEFVAKHHAALCQDFLLDDAVPSIQLAMLDKKRSLELAKTAGVDIPGFWEIDRLEDVDAILESIQFPVIVKPLQSYVFQRHFAGGGRKFFVAENREELVHNLKRVFDCGVDVMITEKIPGPDSLLSSYYTYIDADGTPLFHYTKQMVRRFPKNEGLGCFHRAEWEEDVAAEGLRFFQAIGYRGLGNVEFKRDPRDGRLKIIECNPRFTAAQELLVRCGMDTASLVYNHLTGIPLPDIGELRPDLYYWYPLRDFRAFLELRRLGELTLGGWLRSILKRQVLPFFSVSDPLPTLKRGVRKVLSRLHS